MTRCNIKSENFQKINLDSKNTTKSIKYKLFYDANEKLITRANIRKVILPTKKYTFRNKKKPIISSNQLLKNTSTNMKLFQPAPIECFECNSLWVPCNNSIELQSLKLKRVICSGSCYQYINSNGGKNAIFK